MSDNIIVFDTTCRDGKQAPGNNHSPADTVRLAQQAERLGIDVFEAGFPASSSEDSCAVATVSIEVETMSVCALARSVDADITVAAIALQHAQHPRIHTFIATSDIHLTAKLRMSRAQALDQAVAGVMKARQYVDDVQFSAEDASRSDFPYLKDVLREVILAGARTVNVPDTVGYAMPEEVGELVLRLINEVPEISEHGVVVSVHCHNDLGFATANSLAGVRAGARQVEGTTNGIGERAGNAHLAEVIMALRTRQDWYNVNYRIDTTKLGESARLLSEILNKPIPSNLPIVGESVFAHGAGIHQHGVICNPLVYEIMSPVSVGWDAERFPLSSQSGRHGLRQRLCALGYEINDAVLHDVYIKFLNIASQSTLVNDNQLHNLMEIYQ